MPVNVNQLLDGLNPEWTQLEGTDPPGNYIAGALKQIQDDSASVFPASEYSGQTAFNNRWKSIVQSDFIPISEQERDLEERKLILPKEPLHAKKFTLPKMFNKWRVPSRLTNDHCSRVASVADADEAEDIKPPSRASATELPTLAPRIESRGPPATARASLHSYRPATQRSAFSLPRQQVMSAREPGEFQNATPREYMSPSFRNKFRDPAKPKSLATKQLFRNYQNHEAERKSAEELLKNATDHERRLIEAALRSYDSGGDHEARAMKQWLEGASDKDKSIALEFFKTCNQSSRSPNAKRKMSGLVRELKKGYAQPLESTASSNRCHGDADERQWRHIRLLTPGTRANKGQYQTWHHMHSYSQDNPVINRTSIYTEPQKIIPRHFVIHPDLG